MMRFAVRVITMGLLSLASRGAAAAGHTADARHSQDHGTVIRVEPLGTMDQTKLQQIAAEFPGNISVQNGAKLYRLTYWTTLKGNPTPASGLVAIPDRGSPLKGVVIYLHGTNATRALAPSQPDRIDGNEEAAVFAGNGYVTVLPDYLGLGVSRVPHPYLIVEPQVDASIDLLSAVSVAFPSRNPTNLFMMGFSQGGQVVAGLHRALEREALGAYRLKGSVGIAGPYNLRGTSLPKALENQCRQCVGYLTWAVYAYATYYGDPLKEAIRADFVRKVPGLFDGSKSATEIGAALPDDPAAMFQPRFLTAMRTGGDTWFTRALALNETWAWVPRAPFRLYFGEGDLDVSPSASRAFFDYAKQRGGNVSLYPQANADHQGSSATSYAPALFWFNQLAASDRVDSN